MNILRIKHKNVPFEMNGIFLYTKNALFSTIVYIYLYLYIILMKYLMFIHYIVIIFIIMYIKFIFYKFVYRYAQNKNILIIFAKSMYILP